MDKDEGEREGLELRGGGEADEGMELTMLGAGEQNGGD